MKDSNSTNSHGSAAPEATLDRGFSPWQRLKTKRISYLVLPLLIAATLTEFVILATGWKYQQTVCVPKGMGVMFLGIGPIGAVILAVELLKLPLAIWTATRHGWQKGFMLLVGLPLICLLTFQLVKDMAVYEMGVALAPAGEYLEKASAEEVKITQLEGDLAAIEQKKIDREHKLTELTEKQAKANAALEESLKRNGESRQDAISLTDYQQKELSEVETRQAAIIKQFETDTAQLTKALAELRAQRELEVARASKWNSEEARIENAYKVKMADYANQKAAYEKARAEYESANFLKRQFMREPVDPGVAPVRESNSILKPVEIAELDSQIQAKEAELLAVSNKRRERIAQVEDNARRVREEFDRRSTTKREETDRQRQELLAAHTALVAQLKAEEKQVDQEFHAAAQKVDGIRAEIDASRKKAEEYYEARDASIKNTQVYRIATTVEIIRGLVMGQKPITIKATAKERGDLYTDQISMVRIWVYPVLAFIVAFLPTLMVEIGFSTLFMAEQQKPQHRFGFLGRRLHWIETRAGRQKILRAERIAGEATAQIAARDRALASAQADAAKTLTAAQDDAAKTLTAAQAEAAKKLTVAQTEAARALAEKEAELNSAREAAAAAAVAHEAQLEQQEETWVAKLAGMADTLNRTVVEKDALRDLQKSEIERQIQMRQHAWSDRLNQLRQELDDQRTAAEAERTTLMQEQHKKLMEVTEDCKTQVAQARRQMAEAELAAVEKSAKLSHDLKEALRGRDEAVAQLQQQTESLSVQLQQAREDAAREVEKTSRQEKNRLELQQMEFAKSLRQQEEDFAHKLNQREHELTLAFEARLLEEKNRIEQNARRREADLERQVESRAAEVDAQWKKEIQQREDATQIRLKQQEQQLQAQADVRLNDLQARIEQELRRQKLEFERQLEAQARDADARTREELRQKEMAFHAKLKQREQDLAGKATARENELLNQWALDVRAREEKWEQETESRVRAAEAQIGHSTQQNDEMVQIKVRQREQQLQSQFDARLAELKTQWDLELRSHEQEWERRAAAGNRNSEARWAAQMMQKEEQFQSQARQRDEQWQAKLDALRAEQQAQIEQEVRRREADSANARQRALREQEANLRNEMQQKETALQAKARQREQELSAQLAAQTEEHQAARLRWEMESEDKARATLEHFRTLLDRAEKERDEANNFAAEGFRQVQNLEKKLTEASAFLNGLKGGKNGKPMVGVPVGRNRNGFEEPTEA